MTISNPRVKTWATIAAVAGILTIVFLPISAVIRWLAIVPLQQSIPLGLYMRSIVVNPTRLIAWAAIIAMVAGCFSKNKMAAGIGAIVYAVISIFWSFELLRLGASYAPNIFWGVMELLPAALCALVAVLAFSKKTPQGNGLRYAVLGLAVAYAVLTLGGQFVTGIGASLPALLANALISLVFSVLYIGLFYGCATWITLLSQPDTPKAAPLPNAYAPSAAANPQDLAQLQALLQAGVLTQQEYDRLARVVNR